MEAKSHFKFYLHHVLSMPLYTNKSLNFLKSYHLPLLSFGFVYFSVADLDDFGPDPDTTLEKKPNPDWLLLCHFCSPVSGFGPLSPNPDPTGSVSETLAVASILAHFFFSGSSFRMQPGSNFKEQ
jgi:hypothetical protein